jgi:hypothetical protein
MSDIGHAMLHELRRIRELLEQNQPLGFGKKRELHHLFVRHQHIDGQEIVWYLRSRLEAKNIPVFERDLTGYLTNVQRYDRSDDRTGQVVPRLHLHLHADQDYVIHTGLHTNFAKSFLAATIMLEPEDLHSPVTLVAETNTGSPHRPTVFCRLELHGRRLQPDLTTSVDTTSLLEAVRNRFAFTASGEGAAHDDPDS